MRKKRLLTQDIEQPSHKKLGARNWKSGKQMLYSAGVLALLMGGGAFVSGQLPTAIHVQAATTMPSGFNQIGAIGSAPVYSTSNTAWTNVQKAVDALAQETNAEYYVGSKTSDGKGQAIGWYDGQTQFQKDGSRQTLGSLQSASPSDLSQPNYNFVRKAIMSGADGFTDSDYFTYIGTAGQPFAIHNVGQAFEASTGKFVPVGIKITVNDAKYYDGVNADPKDVFGDGYKLLATARNDGRGNITVGYVVVMTGVQAVDNGGGGEGGGSGGGTGASYGGATTGIPSSINTVITYVNEDTGQALPNNSLSVMKVADVDAGQAASLSDSALGYIVSDPTNVELKDNVLTAKNNATVSQNASNLDANSFIAVKTTNSFALVYTDTLGNQGQGSIIEGLFGTQSVTAPEPNGFLTLDKTVAQYGKDEWNSHYSFDKLQFQVIDKNGKVVKTLSLNAEGKSEKASLLAGDYTLHEISSDWSLIGQTQRPDIKVTIKEGQTTSISGKNLENQAVVGQNTLEKSDKETGIEQDGKAVLKDAKYAYFYNDDSTGSSPHKKDDPIKWADKPGAKLLAGEKVTSAVIGGNKVDFGDNVVIKVSEDKFQTALGNLPKGSYYAKEVDAPEGYAIDGEKHVFNITQKDEKTSNIITENVKSLEQVIKAKITLDKSVTLPEGQGGSGFNGLEFTASPLEGTKAEKVVFKTGVNPTTGDDGYAQQPLTYGDWKVEETKGHEGYDNVKPFYIHMTTDTEKDILTITASYHDDFSEPFSSRTFNLSDNATQTNPNGDDTVGSVTSDTPTISLSTIHLNDNPTTPKVPSIDIEKANDTVPNAGEGNDKDKDNNAGANDHDTEKTALNIEAGKTTTIAGRITNNGTEDLTHIKFSDKQLNGSVQVKNLEWTYKGQKLSTNKEGEFTTSDGKLLVLGVGETITETTGQVASLPARELHGDEFGVSAVGVTSGKTVGDHDKWYAKTPTPTPTPSIDIEKANDTLPSAGEGNDKDKANNAGANDHDTAETALKVEAGKTATITGRITNNGTESLTHIIFSDKQLEGSVKVKNLEWTYKGQKLSTNKAGEFTTSDGKLLVLTVGESITETTGQLASLPQGELHGDEFGVTAVGVISGKKVGDHDKWYGKVEKSATPVQKIANIFLPKTGDSKSIMTAIGAWLVTIAVIVSGVVLNERKRHTLAMSYHKMMRKIRK